MTTPTEEAVVAKAEKLCRCGNYDLAGIEDKEPVYVCVAIVGAPEYGREAHTTRECYREVMPTESWTRAHGAWVRDRALLCPMPTNHLLFTTGHTNCAGDCLGYVAFDADHLRKGDPVMCPSCLADWVEGQREHYADLQEEDRKLRRVGH